ncbi:hypothetical protein [Fretibacterium fastidiosum]|uniref:hypothetical protein n=1 Tax=Fretibacterium fastidiosum TaxID=651822 RepID=UPI0002EFD61A|nr:hypothetical protein [Fretibacterium fastidiosum]
MPTTKAPASRGFTRWNCGAKSQVLPLFGSLRSAASICWMCAMMSPMKSTRARTGAACAPEAARDRSRAAAPRTPRILRVRNISQRTSLNLKRSFHFLFYSTS